MQFTVERNGFPRWTFEEFKRMRRENPYGSGWSRFVACLPGRMDYTHKSPRRIWSVNWYGLAFALRIRCPNALGFFATGPEAEGAEWVLPWNFERRYYEKRVVSRGWNA